MKIKKIFLISFIGIILTTAVLCVFFFNFEHKTEKVFMGYKFTGYRAFEEIVVTIDGEADCNVTEENEFRVKIKISGEDSPFNGTYDALITDKKDEYVPFNFVPEDLKDGYIFGGNIKTDSLKSYIVIVRDDDVFMASTEEYEDFYEMAEALNVSEQLGLEKK